MFVAQLGIGKIAPSRFWIDKDLVYRQSVPQRKLVFSRSKNIWMLPRHEELNCYKYSRNMLGEHRVWGVKQRRTPPTRKRRTLAAPQ